MLIIFQGGRVRVTGPRRHLPMREKSLRTVGDCCWRLHRRRGFRASDTSVSVPANTRWVSPSDWGWPAGAVRSVRVDPDC